MTRRSRTHVRNLFLRVLGGIFVIAFASLRAQVDVLFGARGLLPACEVAAATPLAVAPTLFRCACSDVWLRGAADAGIVLGVLLACLVAPRVVLLALWAVYLSFASVGQDFLSFQWDNLLLETAFFAFWIAPWWRRDTPPHPIAIVLAQSLLVRLNVESGLAKWLIGDPTWRDLTAMVAYYETAPLPTWVGWWAHQLPESAHRFTAAFTYVVELVAPWLVWGPRRVRPAAAALLAAFQLGVVATANYGFFNWLSLALCLLVFDDDHLAARLRRPSPPSPAPPSRARTAGYGLLAAVVLPLSVLPFLPFAEGGRTVLRRPVVAAVRPWLQSLRTLNAYHLFASMTLVRNEAVIEGSDDGTTWKAYELRWKPGDPLRAPPFVAPHQPRVDFQMWFLFLRQGPWGLPPYLRTLLDRLLHDPDAVASLFAVNPFPDHPPHEVRVSVWRYRFTDRATRRTTGAWWTRSLVATSKPVTGD